MLIRGWTENAIKLGRKERLEDRTGRKYFSSLMADRKGWLSDITNYTIKFNNSENQKKVSNCFGKDSVDVISYAGKIYECVK